MAINMTNELRGKMRSAKTADEVIAILEAAEVTYQDSDVEGIMSELQELAKQDGMDLSLDELDAVAGGADYAKNGCFATVEPGSNCTGTDGGCWWINVSYENGPVNYKCPNCGRYLYDLGSRGRSGNDPYMYDLACPYCHMVFQVPEDVYKRL